jgi:hypothetical protein
LSVGLRDGARLDDVLLRDREWALAPVRHEPGVKQQRQGR